MELIIILLFITLSYLILKYVHRLWLSHKWGCGSIKPYNGGILGINFLTQMNKDKNEGVLLEKQLDIFNELDVDTYKVNVLGQKVIMTRNPENNKALVATQFNDFSIGKVRQGNFLILLGHGIFAAEGDRWKVSRETLRPQFAREQIAHIQMLEPHMMNFAKRVRSLNGQEFDIQSLFHKLTLDASTEFLFGESVGSLNNSDSGNISADFINNNGFEEAFNVVQHYIAKRQTAGSFYWLINPKELRENAKKVQLFAGLYVAKALKATPQEIEEKSKTGYTFLYELVKKVKDPKVLQDEMLSIMLAGRNTTASLLSFLFYELSRRPDVWQKLKQDVYQHFGDGDNVLFDKISFESMKKCDYLKWCINETLRLHPSVPRNLRVAKKDTTLPRGGGPSGTEPIFVSKGTSVAINVFGIHRSESHFGKDVDTFRPERWENLKPNWAFIPFSTGPRICLGQQFALTEASYITLRLVQMFPNISTTQDVYPPRTISNATTRLLNGCHISLS